VAKPPLPPYRAPQRRLGPCPTCRLTVMADAWLWSTSTGWQPDGPCVSPVCGESHDCATALIDYAARWQHTVRLAEPRRFP
jgi:hypothetical protein